MDTDLSGILSSKAKYRVLRVLFYQKEPIPLRHIGYLTEMYINSITHALRDLCRSDLVIRKNVGRETHYSLNEKHCLFTLIEDLFKKETAANIASKTKIHSKAVIRANDFINSSFKFFKESHS